MGKAFISASQIKVENIVQSIEAGEEVRLELSEGYVFSNVSYAGGVLSFTVQTDSKNTENDADSVPTFTTVESKGPGGRKKALPVFEVLGVKYYSLDEVGRRIGVTKRTLSTYIKENTIQATKLGGRWCISEQCLNEYINSKKA